MRGDEEEKEDQKKARATGGRRTEGRAEVTILYKKGVGYLW
jgi:hypothetical protein